MENTTPKPIPVFFLSLAIIFAVVAGFFLRQKQKTSQKTSPVTVEKIYTPEETASRILSAKSLYSFLIPSSDLSKCPDLTQNTAKLLNVFTEKSGAVSYITISVTDSGQIHLYQMILLASPPPWKLVACRDLGEPVRVAPK